MSSLHRQTPSYGREWPPGVPDSSQPHPDQVGSDRNSLLVRAKAGTPARVRFSFRSQISAARLFALNRLKQRLEVAFSETAAAFALDDLVKESWTVLNRFG